MTSTEELSRLQAEMRSQVIRTGSIEDLHYIAGADLTCHEEIMIGCFVVLDAKNNLQTVYQKCKSFNVTFPYIPGFLSFREGPVVLSLLDDFQKENPTIKIDVLLVDGNGEWHTRGLGLGSYVGIKCGIPTIGVSKTYFNINGEIDSKALQQDAQTKCPNFGDFIVLEHIFEDGSKVECALLHTTSKVPFKPIFVSIGHMIDLPQSIELVKSLCRFREPEPLRLADRISRQFVRDLLKESCN